VEVGPGQVLTQLVGRILADRPHRAIATDVPGENGLVRLLGAVAELAAAGVALDVTRLFAGRGARLVSVADRPRRPGWLVDGQLVRTADGEPVPGGMRPATDFSPLELPGSPAVAAADRSGPHPVPAAAPGGLYQEAAMHQQAPMPGEHAPSQTGTPTRSWPSSGPAKRRSRPGGTSC
jgi:acyl transferase domain-containing protein